MPYKTPSANAARQARWRRTALGQYHKVRRGATTRSILFKLSFRQFKKIRVGPCHYCEGHLPAAGGGLDRKNSLLGYSIQNCVPCCGDCNRIRNKDLVSYEEMIGVARLLRWYRTGQKTDLIFKPSFQYDSGVASGTEDLKRAG